MLNITVDGEAVLVPVKVVPGASHTRYLGEWDGKAKVAVAAPPEKGKANQAVVLFFAKRLGTPKKNITVAAGHASPIKKIRIERVAPDAVRQALQPAPS